MHHVFVPGYFNISLDAHLSDSRSEWAKLSSQIQLDLKNHPISPIEMFIMAPS